MSIDDRIKAPEGKFAVFVWDPSNPEKSFQAIAKTKTTERKAVYSSERYALMYANKRNQQWYDETRKMKAKGEPYIGEADYFVVNDQGRRIF